MENRETGIVKFFNRSKGYGFIKRDQGGEIFVHNSEIHGLGSLEEGKRVDFIVGQGDKGSRAEDVRVLS